MFNVFSDINWLAVLVAFLASTVLAGVWFAVVIAKAYVVALGREEAGPAPSSAVRNFGPVLCTLVVTVTSAILLEALRVTTAGDALAFGLIVGIGYLAAMTFQIALNPNFPRPLFYGLINAPYFVVTAVVSAEIIVAFG